MLLRMKPVLIKLMLFISTLMTMQVTYAEDASVTYLRKIANYTYGA